MHLAEAVRYGKIGAIPFLLTQCEENEKKPALKIALESRQLEMAKILIDSGVDVNTKSEDEKLSALHLAAEFNNALMIEHLLDLEGVDVNLRNKEGWTPLHVAAIQNTNDSHFNSIEILLQNGGDVNAVDNRGRKAGEYLIKRETTDFNSELFQIFLFYTEKANNKESILDTSFGELDIDRDWDFVSHNQANNVNQKNQAGHVRVKVDNSKLDVLEQELKCIKLEMEKSMKYLIHKMEKMTEAFNQKIKNELPVNPTN